MATENKTSPIRKLKSMYPLRAKVDESYRKSAEAVAAGKPVVWSMANWWQGSSILKALDPFLDPAEVGQEPTVPVLAGEVARIEANRLLERIARTLPVTTCREHFAE